MVPQNFSIPAGNAETVTFDVLPVGIPPLSHATDIVWCVYEQELGIPVAGAAPLITKKLSLGNISFIDSPREQFFVNLDPEDTVNLLRNYYHEATILDTIGAALAVAEGIMTVTATENRI